MASTRGLRSTHLLDFESLKSCGLSTNKARTICDFAKNVGPDSRAVDFWYDLEPRQLIETVKQHRGLGDWTAGIIALFYVGHEDVFPEGDGSLKRAISIINDQMPRKKRQVFDPENAKPYRSYLALYLWRALDSGLLVNGTAT